jgi:hypothetical protein
MKLKVSENQGKKATILVLLKHNKNLCSKLLSHQYKLQIRIRFISHKANLKLNSNLNLNLVKWLLQQLFLISMDKRIYSLILCQVVILHKELVSFQLIRAILNQITPKVQSLIKIYLLKVLSSIFQNQIMLLLLKAYRLNLRMNCSIMSS